jgi:hypothetical protein
MVDVIDLLGFVSEDRPFSRGSQLSLWSRLDYDPSLIL